MQLTFDPRDPNASASVLAVIAALHGMAPEEGLDSAAFSAPAIQPRDLAPGEMLVDAAPAFDAPSPTEAFAPSPFVSPAPTADIATGPAGFTATPTSAPAATVAPAVAPIATAANSAVEIDADGLPWDARIHSGPADKRPKNADGRWRRGRGVDDAQFNAVAAELRQIMGVPGPAVPLAPPVAPASVPVPPTVASAPIPVPPAPQPTPAPVVMESGPVAAAPAASFADLMRKVTRMQTAGLITVEGTSQIAQSLGLTGLRDLMQRPDMVPMFDTLLPAEAA